MRDSIRIGFVTDSHVGKAVAWTDAASSLDLHWRDVSGCVAWCEQQHCTHLAWLGDLFHMPLPSQPLLALGLRALDASRLPSTVTLGNHEVRDGGTHALELLGDLPARGALAHVGFAFLPGVVRMGAWRVGVVPWGHQIPDETFDALLFHEAAVGAKMDNGRPSTRGLRGIADLQVPAVGGHLHVPQSRGDLYFAGTSTQKSFGEPPRKRMLHLTLRHGRDPTWTSMPVRDPAWRLERIAYDARNPPRCDDAHTYYSLDVGGEAPPSRWMVDHPRVVTTHGASTERALRAASKVVNLLEGQSTQGTDDRALLVRWLRQHSALDDLMRANAVRIHDRRSKPE